jgi:acyl carrier protein
MNQTGATDVTATVREILAEVLPEPLPPDWPADRPLTEAGLDSVGVVTMIGELESRFGIALDETDLSEDQLGTLAGIAALVRRKRSDG